MRRTSHWLLAAAILLLSACSSGQDSSSSLPGSPTTPTPTGGGGSTGSATINGTVASSSGTQSVATTHVMNGVATVQVVGTPVTSGVDSAGRFTLINVPAGTIQLRFSGPTADATTAVNGLGAGETIAIVVSVAGSQASIISDSRNPNAPTPPGGPMPPPAAPTPPSPAPPTPAPAPNPPQDESASIEGPCTSLTGGAPSLVLVVNGTTVRTSASTDVQRRGDKQDLGTLRVGQTLHVIGVRRSDGSIDARQIQIKDDATGGQFEIEGSMGGLKGSCPSLTFKVNGYSVATGGATAFPNASCSSFKNGDKVRVKGVRQADDSVAATSVEKQ